MMKQTAVAKGVYRDKYGYQVKWTDGRRRSQRFPSDAPLDELKAFRKRMLSQATSRKTVTVDGSFARDVVRFLRGRKQRACYKSDRAHLRSWAVRFKRRSRFDITRPDIVAAVEQWKTQYSAREVRHRVAILRQLFRALDTSTSSTPCDGIKLPKPSKQKRLPVPASIVRTVAENLQKHEQKAHGTRLRDARTRARFLILALTGQRPAQLMRTGPEHVDLDARIWYVPAAKGDNGAIVYLNDQMITAWTLFIAADAFGEYDTRSFSKTLKRNGWPKDVAPYALRRTVAQRLRDSGVDITDVQDHLGHASPSTTRTFYADQSLPRLRAVSAHLDGFFSTDALALPAPRAEPKARRTA